MLIQYSNFFMFYWKKRRKNRKIWLKTHQSSKNILIEFLTKYLLLGINFILWLLVEIMKRSLLYFSISVGNWCSWAGSMLQILFLLLRYWIWSCSILQSCCSQWFGSWTNCCSSLLRSSDLETWQLIIQYHSFISLSISTLSIYIKGKVHLLSLILDCNFVTTYHPAP